MTTSTIATCDHGIVTRTKRVIMDRDIYEKKWKLGPFSKKKADLKEQGKLDKYGRMTDSTPEAWKLLFGDDAKATTVKEVAKALKVPTPADEPAKKKSSRKTSNVGDGDDEKPAKKPSRKSSNVDQEQPAAKKSSCKASGVADDGADLDKKKKREAKASAKAAKEAEEAESAKKEKKASKKASKKDKKEKKDKKSSKKKAAASDSDE